MHKIRATTLHQEIVSRIRKMVQKGTLVRGQKVNEKDLCESMGVSRTPVREALRQLTSEGLIQLIPHKGAFVSQPCIEEISDLFEVMSVLEGTCARLAATHMKERDLQKIETLHKELEAHYQNRVLNDVINGLRQKILLYRQRQLYQPERFDQSVQEHRNLLRAFRTRDPDSAESLMKHHLLMQCKALVGLYANKEAEERGKAAP
jgi:DNA-binding GntR family transcriptional regulator